MHVDMKITVTLKDPDGFSECVDEAVKESLDELEGLDEGEKEDLLEHRLEKTWDKLEKFVDCQEYLRVEFDTEAGTATVLPNKR
jgi:5'-deoxynucleotidase YfbR-like HD superfamily hydrolase